MASVKEGILLSLGNPLLDVQSKVEKAFLDKWGLKENDAILCDDKMLPMFDDLVATYKDQIEYVAGGSAQNTMRVAQWILKKPKSVIFMGCVGKDKYGQILESKASEVGVNVVYQIHPTLLTGKCAVCIYEHNRSLCAHLAAANCFTISHLEVAKHWELVQAAQFYYVAGFHLTVCPAAILKLAQHASGENKTFCMNLSAPFICSAFKEPLLAAFPYIDVLFGNEAEAAEFAKENGINASSMEDIASQMANMPKVTEKRPRMVIITQGADPAIVAQGDKIHKFPVAVLDKSKIVDTNGAGDAFAGGFLSQLVQGKPLAACVDAGMWAAGVIIQNSGCTFPAKCDYTSK